MSENWFHKKAETNQFPLKSTIRIQKWEEATPNNHLSPFFMEDKIQKEQAGTKCVHDRNHARLVHAISLTVHDKSWTLFQFKKNRNLFWLMYVSFGYELTFHKKKKKKRSHVSTVSLYLELVSSVYSDENHWAVVRLRLDLPPGTSLVPSNRCVFTQSQQ